MLAFALLMTGCSLLSDTPEIIERDGGAADGGTDTSFDAATDASETDDGGTTADAQTDMTQVDPLAGPEHTPHRIGLITERNAKFANKLNVLFQFERLVYPEDEIATLANNDPNYPDHDLFILRTGGVEPLRTSERPVISFVPWAEDDILISAEPTPTNYPAYSELEIVDNDLGLPVGAFDPFVTEVEESWFGMASEHAEGVTTVGRTPLSDNDVGITHATAGADDINGDPFAGERVGFYFAFHRRDVDLDSEPAFDIWSTKSWTLYMTLRDRFLPDNPANGRTAVIYRNGQTGMGLAVVVGRLQRLGFAVEIVDEDAMGARPPEADLYVLWPGVSALIGESLPARTPVLAFPVDGELLSSAGFLPQAGSFVRGLEHRWILEEIEIVPASRAGSQVDIVNTNETTLALPPADDILSLPESRLPAQSKVVARLAENGNVTAFVADGESRRAFIGLDPNAVARANVDFAPLFDRMVLWLFQPQTN